MKRISFLIILAAASVLQVSCNVAPDPAWPPSPPPAAPTAHRPWGDNWFIRDAR